MRELSDQESLASLTESDLAYLTSVSDKPWEIELVCNITLRKLVRAHKAALRLLKRLGYNSNPWYEGAD